MSIVKNTEADFTALRDDLATLKNDMAALVSHVTASATSSAQSVANQAEKRARDAYNNVSIEGEKAAKIIGGKIEEQPVTALLIALGVGYIAARLIAR